MTSSTRSSPRSTTTRTTRSPPNERICDHGPHTRECASRLKGWGSFFVKPIAASFETRSLRGRPANSERINVCQALLLRDPGSRTYRRRWQAEGGLPQARDEVASGQESRRRRERNPLQGNQRGLRGPQGRPEARGL